MAFVIIASPRTGSTHLTALLHKHSEIICHGEIFHPKKEKLLGRWKSSRQVPESASEMFELRRRDPQQFLRRVFENDHGGKHVGFKIFNGHNDEILDEFLRRNGLRNWLYEGETTFVPFEDKGVEEDKAQFLSAEHEVSAAT